MMECEENVVKQISEEAKKIFKDLIDRMTCLEKAMARYKVENERTRSMLKQGYDPCPHLRLVKK